MDVIISKTEQDDSIGFVVLGSGNISDNLLNVGIFGSSMVNNVPKTFFHKMAFDFDLPSMKVGPIEFFDRHERMSGRGHVGRSYLLLGCKGSVYSLTRLQK